MSSCERPRKRSAREALPSSVSNLYALSTLTHGSSWRHCATWSLCRVRSFSASSSSSRAASHSFRVPVLCFVIDFSPSSRVRCTGPLRPGRHGIDCAGAPNSGSDKCVGIRMDSLITAAARALAIGDPLGALKRVALRGDAPALALRGIAMAQLGDLARARVLLRSAARGFGSREPVARARCLVAEAEIALVSRDLSWPAKLLHTARATLERHGDHANATHARYLQVRRLLLIGRLDEAEQMLADFDHTLLPPRLRAAHDLVVAGLAMRRLHIKEAREAIERAGQAACEAGIPALTAEVEHASRALRVPAARLASSRDERPLLLDAVETVLTSEKLIVDECSQGV